MLSDKFSETGEFSFSQTFSLIVVSQFSNPDTVKSYVYYSNFLCVVKDGGGGNGVHIENLPACLNMLICTILIEFSQLVMHFQPALRPGSTCQQAKCSLHGFFLFLFGKDALQHPVVRMLISRKWKSYGCWFLR